MRMMMIGMAGLILCLWTVSAQAQCTTDADCASGEVCVWAPCPAIDCAPGESCPEPSCPEEGACETATSDVYWGEACDTDADCPYGFNCDESGLDCETYSCGCACPPCEPGTTCEPCECDCPEPPPCEAETLKVCAYAPRACQSDGDCEAGFECQAEEVCYGTSCSCAEPAPCACPDCPPGETCEPCDCPEPEPCDCPEPTDTCEVVGMVCAPKTIPCSTASDCPSDWECATLITSGGTDCACAGCACDPSAESCECPPCDCPEPEPEETTSVCMPPGWTSLLDADSSSGGVTRGESPAESFSENVADPSTPMSGGSEEGGCSVTRTAVSGSGGPAGPLALILGAGLFALSRRRRR